jgi:predicted PurR-regulated permease PerM
LVEPEGSTKWGTTTKTLVAMAGFVILALVVVRFQSIIQLLVVAGIASFLLVPIVRILRLRARLSWTGATNVVFLFLILILITASTATSLALVQQLQSLVFTIQRFLLALPEQITNLSGQAVTVGPWVFDLSRLDLAPIADQALVAVQPTIGRITTLVTSLASVAIESIARLVFVLAAAYFLTVDYEKLRAGWTSLTIPGYEQDTFRLRRALGNIWDAFLRGQSLVAVITGTLTGLMMLALGVRSPLGLGLLGGLAKFVPILGPLTAGALAAVVTLFQPGNWYGLPPLSHAILVILCVIVLDQSIDYLLIPRLMGQSLNLHPVIILVGAIVGASLAGVLGLLLSAPSMATLLLIGRYITRKLLDQSPWDPPIDLLPAQRRPAIRIPRLSKWLARRETPDR